MPTILKINLNRKVTQDFQSQGFGLEIQAELPWSAAGNPNEMAQASDELFRLAEDLLAEQMSRVRFDQGQEAPRNGVRVLPVARSLSKPNGPLLANRFGNQNPGANGTAKAGNGHTSQQTSNGERLITQSQTKAIERMAQKLETNGDVVAGEDFGKKLTQLTLKEASTCIDNLKRALEGPQAVGDQR